MTKYNAFIILLCPIIIIGLYFLPGLSYKLILWTPRRLDHGASEIFLIHPRNFNAKQPKIFIYVTYM